MITPEKLKELRESTFAPVVKEYIQEQINKMSDVSSYKSWDEVLGKQYATRVLTDFLRVLELKPEKEKIPNQYR